MANYLFAWHGGRQPETPEEDGRVMKAWEDWLTWAQRQSVLGCRWVYPRHSIRMAVSVITVLRTRPADSALSR